MATTTFLPTINRNKSAVLLKGFLLGLLVISSYQLVQAVDGNAEISPAKVALNVGWLMAVVAGLEIIELVIVKPTTMHKWFGVYKTLTVIAAIVVPVVLLTPVVGSFLLALQIAAAATIFCTVIDGAEALYL